MFISNLRIEKRCDLWLCNCGMAVGAREDVEYISLGIVSRVYAEMVQKQKKT